MGKNNSHSKNMVKYQSRRFRIGAILVLIYILFGLIGPSVAPYTPDDQDIEFVLTNGMAPSYQHWLGTDDLGRDYLARYLYAARNSLIVVAISASITAVVSVYLVPSVTSIWHHIIHNWFAKIPISVSSLALRLVFFVILVEGVIPLAGHLWHRYPWNIGYAILSVAISSIPIVTGFLLPEQPCTLATSERKRLNLRYALPYATAISLLWSLLLHILTEPRSMPTVNAGWAGLLHELAGAAGHGFAEQFISVALSLIMWIAGFILLATCVPHPFNQDANLT